MKLPECVVRLTLSSGKILSMDIPPPPPFEPDFDVESPLWYFSDEPAGFYSGRIFIPIIDATDEMIQNSPEVIDWLLKPF